jgi:hypothetical protein
MIPDVVAKSVAGGRATGFSMFAWKAATRREGVTPGRLFLSPVLIVALTSASQNRVDVTGGFAIKTGATSATV